MTRRNCDVCSTPFEAQRPQARYCGKNCRTRAHRAGIAASRTPERMEPRAERDCSGLVDAVTAELEAAERLNTVAGQHALELANRIVSAPSVSTGVASMSKQLQSVLAEALRGAEQKRANLLDELRERRDRKRASAG